VWGRRSALWTDRPVRPRSSGAADGARRLDRHARRAAGRHPNEPARDATVQVAELKVLDALCNMIDPSSERRVARRSGVGEGVDRV
jgi:hypothetical protein